MLNLYIFFSYLVNVNIGLIAQNHFFFFLLKIRIILLFFKKSELRPPFALGYDHYVHLRSAEKVKNENIIKKHNFVFIIIANLTILSLRFFSMFTIF